MEIHRAMLLRLLQISMWPILILAGAGVILMLPWLREKGRHRRQRRDSLIAFQCGSCGKQIVVDEQVAGRMGRCTGCGATLLIPRFWPFIL